MAKPNVIAFDCPACGKGYRVPAAMAGRGAKCKRCGETMRVPKPDAADSGGKDGGLIPLVDDDDAPKPVAPKPVRPRGKTNQGKPKRGKSSRTRSGARPKPRRQTEPADDSGELHSIDDLMAMGEDALPWDGSSAVGALAEQDTPRGAQPSMAGPRASPPASAALVTAPPPVVVHRSAYSGSHKSGFRDGLSSMWEALVDSTRRSHAKVPLTRRVSMGGLFLLLGGVLLVVLGMRQTLTDPTEELLASIDFGRHVNVARVLPTNTPPLLAGGIALVVSVILLVRRAWSPRDAPESPVVVYVVWGLTLLIAAASVFVFFGEHQTARQMVVFGTVCVCLATAVFGAWVALRMNNEMDGEGLMLILIPAIVLPVATLATTLLVTYQVAKEEDIEIDWANADWEGMFLSVIATFFLLVLAGGAISVWLAVVVPVVLLTLGMLGGGIKLGLYQLIVAGCVCCYLWLIVTRWRLMLKPVGWQFIMMFVGLIAMGQFLATANDMQLFAEGKVFKTSDGGLMAVDSSVVAYTRERDGWTIHYNAEGEVLGLSAGVKDGVTYRSRTSNPSNSTPTRTSPAPNQGTFESPAPALTDTQLPRGLDAPPVGDAGWPAFGRPVFDLGAAHVLSYRGYRLRVAPGYEVVEMGPDDAGAMGFVLRGPKVGNSDVTFELRLVPQDARDQRQAEALGWGHALRMAGASPTAGDTQYGSIGGVRFARGGPAIDRPFAYGDRVVYVGQLAPRSPMRVTMRFPAHRDGADQVLACEAMARSFERVEPEPGPAWPEGAAGLTSPLFDYRPEAIEAGDWRTAGIFAYPRDLGSFVTVERAVERGLAVWVGTPGGGEGARITMTPMRSGTETIDAAPAIPWLQASGPREPGHADPRIAGARVLAFGGRTRYVRLWGDAVFVRVDHGVSRVDRFAGPIESVTYYGFLGGYWTEVALTRRPGRAVPMAELETRLGRLRLATPREIVEDRGASDWLTRLLRHEPADLPLAGGVLLRDAVALDDAGRAAFAPGFHPDAAFGGRTFPPIDQAQLAPYLGWSADPAMDEHLGDAERVGPVELRPLAELQRSARSTREQVEWFARTREGRLGMTLRLEPLGPGEVSRPIPVEQDAETGDWRLHLGRRSIRLSEPPEPAYREHGGLRVWRVLMPQVPGVEMRRCYYVAALPEHTLIVSANFAHDANEQLKAFDAAVATLVYTAD